LIPRQAFAYLKKGCDLMGNPIEVEVDGDIERAFKNLKKKMAFEGIFKELKRRRYYEKPSEEKKRKREEAERRRVKKIRRMAFQTAGKGKKIVKPAGKDQEAV
jgi:small subunit ribosomal protein S21